MSSWGTWRSNFTLNQKVDDISVRRKHAPVSRASDRFHPDKHDALLFAHCRFISSSSVASWKKYSLDLSPFHHFYRQQSFTFRVKMLVYLILHISVGQFTSWQVDKVFRDCPWSYYLPLHRLKGPLSPQCMNFLHTEIPYRYTKLQFKKLTKKQS